MSEKDDVLRWQSLSGSLSRIDTWLEAIQRDQVRQSDGMGQLALEANWFSLLRTVAQTVLLGLILWRVW